MKTSLLTALFAKAKSIRAIRFLVVGVLNTSFSYLIYAGFLYIGLGYQLANFLSLVVGILFSFKTQGRLVFNNPDNRLLGRFVLSWLVIYVCVIVFIGRIIALGLDAYTAGALSLPLSVGLSYLTQKYFVFRQTTKVIEAIDRA